MTVLESNLVYELHHYCSTYISHNCIRDTARQGSHTTAEQSGSVCAADIVFRVRPNCIERCRTDSWQAIALVYSESFCVRDILLVDVSPVVVWVLWIITVKHWIDILALILINKVEPNWDHSALDQLHNVETHYQVKYKKESVQNGSYYLISISNIIIFSQNRVGTNTLF